jgi:hypothetical protein
MQFRAETASSNMGDGRQAILVTFQWLKLRVWVKNLVISQDGKEHTFKECGNSVSRRISGK